MIQSNRLKDLRAAIALQRADAHLREGFQQPLVDRLDKVLFGVIAGDVLRQKTQPLQIV